MGCMQSTAESNLSPYDGQSSLILYRLAAERYNVQVQPPSLINKSILHRMQVLSHCPSEVFVNLDMDKCFQAMTDTSQNGDQRHEPNKKHSRSQIISLKIKRGSKIERAVSEVVMNH